MRRKTKKMSQKVLSIVFCVCIYAFLFLPIVVIVINSFNATTSKPYLSWKGFSLMWYVKLLKNSVLLDSFANTMIIAACSTVISTIIGTLGAVGMYKYTFRGKGVIDALLYIPVVIPEIVLGISLLTLFANIHIPRGMLTLILAHVTFCIPFVIFNIRARLAEYDLSIEEASMDLGANRFRTFFEITLPVLAPGIAGGALLAFTLSIDDVIISYFVNGQTKTYPLKVMESIKSGVSPDVNALSALILVGTILAVFVTQSNLFRNKGKKIPEVKKHETK
ncbi:MAG: ABC transporter permease [Treponema sp.]